MSLFDALVDEAIRNSPELAVLRPVVEKELLHHDILRLMSDAGLLVLLTFIGGTCLRACYGSGGWERRYVEGDSADAAGAERSESPTYPYRYLLDP